MDRDEQIMRLALEEADRAREQGEVPVGAVIVMGDGIIARAHNSCITLHDPSAHAEMLAIRQACLEVDNYRLVGASLYVTLEPCLMCAGAIIQARIDRLVFGAADHKSGAVVSLYQVLGDKRLNHHVAIAAGILESECGEILSRFFQGKRVTSPAL